MDFSHNKPISSLLAMSIEKVVSSLGYYIDNELDDFVKALPSHIKSRILNKFTSSSYFWKNVKITSVLPLLIDCNTKRLDFTSFMVNDDMLACVKDCKNLNNFYLLRNEEHKLSIDGLINLLDQIPNVRLLVLANCKAVSDAVIEKLVICCPNLSGLDIGGCTNISDKSLECLSKLHNLLRLTISKTNITNQGIANLLQGNSAHKIKELRVADCVHITDQILNNVAECCPALEVLIFYNKYNKYADQTTASHFEQLKYLKQLTWTIQW